MRYTTKSQSLLRILEEMFSLHADTRVEEFWKDPAMVAFHRQQKQQYLQGKLAHRYQMKLDAYQTHSNRDPLHRRVGNVAGRAWSHPLVYGAKRNLVSRLLR